VEIKDELIIQGYNFISNSDTEVILAAWQKWGIECQQKFNGMWAFVIYDSKKREIFISRDRFGIKPFYYWFAPDGSFCFASEIKAFTTCEGWKAKLNPQRVYDYLIYSYTDHTEETMFSGVYQIPGGHYFQAKIESILPNQKRKINTIKWYEFPQKPYNGTFEEASKQFEALFKSSIKLHLRADVPVGTALSGGLDSSAIVCEMNNILKEQGAEDLQKTFSSCSENERFDEKKWMDIVVNHTSVDAHFIYPKLEDVFKMTPNLIWFHDEPYQSLSAFSAYNVFQLVESNNIKVLLNGQGADEYLGGYGQFTYARLVSKIRRLKWVQLYK
jgi:asparagine synthase (glutamine-hydrolysing)